MKSFLASLWQRLTEDLGLQRSSYRAYPMDETLVQLVHDLAEREQRPEEEIAADLLSFALAQRDAAEARLSCWQSLSPREQEVAALTCLNYTNRQIAERLVIAPDTVKTHVRGILRKFGVNSKAELRKMLADWNFDDWSASS